MSINLFQSSVFVLIVGYLLSRIKQREKKLREPSSEYIFSEALLLSIMNLNVCYHISLMWFWGIILKLEYAFTQFWSIVENSNQLNYSEKTLSTTYIFGEKLSVCSRQNVYRVTLLGNRAFKNGVLHRPNIPLQD